MAHQWLRCNLLASDFPLLTDLFGEPVSIKGLDQQTGQNDAQLFYCENVMPTSAGYQSIAFINRNLNGPPDTGSHGLIEACYNFSYSLGGTLRRTYLATSDSNFTGLYVFNTITFTWGWVTLPGAPGLVVPRAVSSAIVNNQCYICPAGQGLFHYNAGPNTFSADAVTGITATSIQGVCASNGLLIAWGAGNFIAWSSNINPLDFTPSLITGAGGGNIGEVRGQIIYCAAISGGFIIYATGNTVQANYTGNANFPFKFQEIPGSGGIISDGQVAFQDNSNEQFAWTDKGLQGLQIGSLASSLLPQLTEFLMAGYYETFDPATGIFTKVQTKIQYPSASYTPLINFIASRYLTVSYGWSNPTGFINQFDYCLILDTQTGRLGKIKSTHVDVFDWVVDGEGSINPLARLGFITKEGAVTTVDLRLEALFDVIIVPESVGLMVIGKFQLQRNKGIFHQRTKVESSYNDLIDKLSVKVMPSLDGKTFETPVSTTKLPGTGLGIQAFAKKVYGLNTSLLIQGPFNMSSLQADFTLGGSDRNYG